MVSLIFLKRSLVFPILLFSSISLHWSLRKAFLSLLAILWNSAFKWEYLYFSPLLFTSLLFTAMCKTSSDNHFAFLHFFSLGMVLIPASCTMNLRPFPVYSHCLANVNFIIFLFGSLPRGRSKNLLSIREGKPLDKFLNNKEIHWLMWLTQRQIGASL